MPFLDQMQAFYFEHYVLILILAGILGLTMVAIPTMLTSYTIGKTKMNYTHAQKHLFLSPLLPLF